jgi:hypothetical protein
MELKLVYLKVEHRTKLARCEVPKLLGREAHITGGRPHSKPKLVLILKVCTDTEAPEQVLLVPVRLGQDLAGFD